MSSYFDPALIFYAVVFLAVVLLIEGIFIYWRDVKGPQSRVSKRMQLLAAGATNSEILASLRRDTSNASASLLPGLFRYFENRLSQAGMKTSVPRLLTIMGSTTVTVGVLFPILGGISGQIQSFAAYLLIVIFAVAIGVVLPIMYINVRATKRIKLFEAQFPTALDIFVRGLRAGYPVTSALELLVTEVPDPISSEFGLVVAEMNYGYNLRDALANLAHRVQTQDIQMFVVSVAIQSETGGSLADILQGLSQVIRDRASMVLKVRALASEGKMTGMMLSGLPIFAFIMTFAGTPSFYLDVVEDPWFLPAVIGVLTMYTCGILLMRKIVAIKV
ncbi:MAG: secretion system protein [Alphaproteobacteria bacterium]|nr:MAG: secretion system protein [Alphaproteobacteria bacterium]